MKIISQHTSDAEFLIISLAEYECYVMDERFVSLVDLGFYCLCSYCHELKGNFEVKNCIHCSAPVREGYQLVGGLMEDPRPMFVKVSELRQTR